MIKIYFSLPAVPPPSVTITHVPSTALFTGSDATLYCTVNVNEAVDTEVVVSVSWRKSGVIILSGDRIWITNVEPRGPLSYESTLAISPLSIQDRGEYSCEVTIHPELPSQLITGNTGTFNSTPDIQGKSFAIM